MFSVTNSLPWGWLAVDVRKTAVFTSQNEGVYFGWKDSKQDNARELTSKFIEPFPEIIREAAIEDWTYAGWLTSILSQAEHGHLPVFYGGLDRGIDASRGTPLSPSIESSANSRREDEPESSLIETERLTQGMLPSDSADTEEMSHFFGVSYPIYERGILEQ